MSEQDGPGHETIVLDAGETLPITGSVDATRHGARYSIAQRGDLSLPYEVEASVAAPAIVLMNPGEKPTEEGWYVADGRFAHLAGRHVIEVAETAGVLGKVELHAIVAGTADPVWLSEFVFIARIYPERIEGRTER